jgi:broad specificity phosphatase PhoE
MAELWLVRHGQASFGKANYDELSPLGVQQCRWLGQHLHDLAIGVERVVTGTLHRHTQSAAALFEGLADHPPLTQHPGFNEYDFIGLHDAYLKQHPKAAKPSRSNRNTVATQSGPERHREFYRVLKSALDAWVRGEIELPDGQNWPQFADAVAGALQSAQATKAVRTLVMTSGGVIATAVGQSLALDSSRVFDLNLQIRNSAVTQFFFNETNLRFASFNSVAHLEREDRIHAITYS